MRSIIPIACAALVASAGPAGAADEPFTFTTDKGSVTVIAPEATWTLPDEPCETFPVDYKVAFDPAGTTSWQIDGHVRSPGRGIADYVSLDGQSAGTVRDEVRLCDSDGHGTMTIDATVGFYPSGTTAAISVPFTVSRMRTAVRLTSVTRDATTTYLRGKALAFSPRLGKTGAQGSVRIDAKRPGKAWRKISVTPAWLHFEWTVFKVLPRGTTFRATLLANAKQEASTSKVLRG
jgi:hypothetical protein